MIFYVVIFGWMSLMIMYRGHTFTRTHMRCALWFSCENYYYNTLKITFYLGSDLKEPTRGMQNLYIWLHYNAFSVDWLWWKYFYFHCRELVNKCNYWIQFLLIRCVVVNTSISLAVTTNSSSNNNNKSVISISNAFPRLHNSGLILYTYRYRHVPAFTSQHTQC